MEMTLNKLHLGCGTIAPAGWHNVDGSINVALARWPRVRSVLMALRIVPRTAAVAYPSGISRLDITKPLPFLDGSFDSVYSSHTLEHLYLSQTQALLRECFRVLRPGGVARMLVPDLRAICEEYFGLRKLDWHSDQPVPACAGDLVNRRLLMREPNPGAGGIASRANRALFDLHSHKWMFDGESLAHHMASVGFVECRVRGFLESDIPGIADVEMSSRIEGGQGVCVEGRKPFG